MSNKKRRDNEILHMQVRLFRMACKKWKLTTKACAELFDDFRIDQYIRDLYGLLHIQGDEANLAEIEMYLKAKGVETL